MTVALLRSTPCPAETKNLPVSRHAQATPTAGKNLAGAGEDSSLTQWVENNRSIYDAVMNGTSGLNERDQAQFMEWWDWAYDQISGVEDDWGSSLALEETGSEETMDGSGEFSSSDPFGGVPGTQGNWIYNEEKAVVGFNGDGVRDIWSNDVTIQIPTLSARVAVERTVDTGWHPPEEILKITVTDPATGTEAVYKIHDAADAEITVETPTESQITDHTGGAVAWKKFSANSTDENSVPESSVPGVEENGQWVYEGRVGETISFRPQADGQEQEHVVWGNADITVGTRDGVAVETTEIPDPANPGESLPATKVTVTHPDGSTDTYYQPQGMGFTLNLNAISSRVAWEGLEAGAVEGVPEEFQEFVTLNASEEMNEEGEVEVDGDSPTETEDGERIFDGGSFDIYSRKDGKTTNVYARNDVTLHASSNREYWTMEWQTEPEGFVVKVYGDESHSDLQETLFIDNMADGIKLDIDPSQVEFLGDLREEFDPHRLNPGWETAQKISFLNEGEPGAANPNWPEAGRLSGYIVDSQSGAQAKEFVEALDEAIASGDWSRARFLVSSLNGEVGNDVMRKFLTALWCAVDGEQAKFDAALDQIPADLRQEMSAIAYATWIERSEKAIGDRWNSHEASTILSESIG